MGILTIKKQNLKSLMTDMTDDRWLEKTLEYICFIVEKMLYLRADYQVFTVK